MTAERTRGSSWTGKAGKDRQIDEIKTHMKSAFSSSPSIPIPIGRDYCRISTRNEDRTQTGRSVWRDEGRGGGRGASPAESYPRYSRRARPLQRVSAMYLRSWIQFESNHQLAESRVQRGPAERSRRTRLTFSTRNEQ